VDPENRNEKDNEANRHRVIRGGSWFLGPLGSRSSARAFYDQPAAACYLGFRVVREATDQEASRFENPHAVWSAAKKQVEAAGGNFYSLNRIPHVRFDENVTADDLVALSQLPGVHRIQRLRAEPFTQAHIDALARMSGLEHLQISRDIGLGDGDLSGLGSLARLSELSLGNENGLTDKHVEQLGGLTSLVTFQIGGLNGRFSDAGLRRLNRNRKLRELRLYEVSIDGSFLDAFEGIPLRSLTVHRRAHDEAASWDDTSSTLLAKTVPHLTSLSFNRQLITDAGLVGLEKLSRLNRLDLGECPNLSEEAVARLLASSPRLSDLTLRSVEAGDRVAAQIPRIYFLKRFRINSKLLTDRGMEQIARSRTLVELEFGDGCANITPAGVGRLGLMPNLEKLRLSGSGMIGEGIEGLARAPALKDFSFHGEGLCEELIETLSRLKHLEKIEIRGGDFETWKPKIEQAAPAARILKR
ncbi:MAG: hypothetical protein AAF492_18935, partial [Verrucomicrobiota bacterium]